MRERLFVFVCLVAVTGCPSPVDPDGGLDADGGADGSVAICARDGDCGDQSLFCERWRCRPGDPGTDARGCIEIGSTCEPGQPCDEETASCGIPAWCTEGRDGCMLPGDCDGDGSRATVCGGDDCDDDDPNRFPGNPEVCDAEGIDEDCDPATFGTTDDDGDGFISAACCNGDACGPDCNDADGNVNPGAAETCDGIDNDCDGEVDEAESLLCPGGACVAGRCNLDAWSRTLGAVQDDAGAGVAQDAAGNVYVVGSFHGTINVGGEEHTAGGASDGLLVKLSPLGAIEWSRSFGTSHIDTANDVAVMPDGRVFVSGSIGSGFDFGGGPRTFTDSYSGRKAFVLALDADGSYLWDRVEFQGTALVEVTTADQLVVVADVTRAATIAGEPFPEGDYVLVHSPVDGTLIRDWPVASPGGTYVRAHDVAADSTSVVVGGWLGTETDFGNGMPIPANGFVAKYELATGTLDWVITHTGQIKSEAVEIGSSGEVYAVGTYDGVGSTVQIVAGVPETTVTAVAHGESFLLALDADGTYRWHKTFFGMSSTGSASSARATALDLTAAGEPVVAGAFWGTINFGGGLLSGGSSSSQSEGFVVWFSAAGAFVDDVPTNGSGAAAIEAVSIGPADSTAITGWFTEGFDFGGARRASSGGQDLFVARFGS